jgi:hypothetical protein
MTESDRAALKRLLGGDASRTATTDDLQGLLLQIVFALLMVFMIAYFIFVETSRAERAEEILEVNRQKLVLALEKVAEDRRVRYGLNALMTQGTDGRRTFDADAHVKGGRIDLAPAARAAFASGSAAACADYRDRESLAAAWRADVLAEASLDEDALTADEKVWLGDEVARSVEEVRLDARGVQRALAVRLQRQWIANPSAFDGVADPGALADALKTQSLKFVAEATGAEVLP